MPKIALVLNVHNEPETHILQAYHSVAEQCKSNGIDLRVAVDKRGDHMNIDHTGKVDTFEYGNLSKVLNYYMFHEFYDYIFRMDGDDISHPCRIKMQLDYLNNHPDVDVLGTNLTAFNQDGELWSTDKKEVPELNTTNKYWIVNHGTCLLKCSSVRAVGGYNETLLRAQDVDLWSRMFTAGYKFRNVTEKLYFYRRSN